MIPNDLLSFNAKQYASKMRELSKLAEAEALKTDAGHTDMNAINDFRLQFDHFEFHLGLRGNGFKIVLMTG